VRENESIVVGDELEEAWIVGDTDNDREEVTESDDSDDKERDVVVVIVADTLLDRTVLMEASREEVGDAEWDSEGVKFEDDVATDDSVIVGDMVMESIAELVKVMADE
jgi:hypothetical protein